MTARRKGGGKPSPASQQVRVRIPVDEWPNVEALAPGEDEVAKWFGTRKPSTARLDSIRYFVAGTRNGLANDAVKSHRNSIEQVAECVKAARAAALELTRRLQDLEALSDDEIGLLPVRSIIGFLPQVQTDLGFLEYGLRAPAVQREWQSIAQDALFYVIDPALMSIGRDTTAVNDRSVRVLVLEKLLAACGVIVTPGAIRQWLKTATIPPTVFLAKNCFPKQGIK